MMIYKTMLLRCMLANNQVPFPSPDQIVQILLAED